ncbi:19017_t:CDS:2, partial [Gigaspora margarita]
AMSKNNFVIARDSEREVISVLIIMIEAYKEWLINEKNNNNEYYMKLYKLFDDRKNEDNKDDETKFCLIDDIVKMIQERELKRKHIAEGYQSIKVGPSEQKLFELIEEKENEDNYSKLCRVNDFETMVKERELKRLDIAK